MEKECKYKGWLKNNAAPPVNYQRFFNEVTHLIGNIHFGKMPIPYQSLGIAERLRSVIDLIGNIHFGKMPISYWSLGIAERLWMSESKYKYV